MIKKLLLLLLLPVLACCNSESSDDLEAMMIYNQLHQIVPLEGTSSQQAYQVISEEITPVQFEMETVIMNDQPVSGESIPYELIEQGCVSYYSMCGGVEVPDYELLICRSEEEFAQFWSLHQSGLIFLDGYINDPPNIDFNTNMVLIVMSPLLNYTADHLHLEGIYKTGEEVIVAATMNIAGKCCIHLTAGSQPYIIIALEQSDDVWLSMTERTYSCCY